MVPMTPRSTTPTKGMQNSNATEAIPIKHASPPRTPRRRKDPPSSYPKSARLAAATGTSFFDDLHGYERDSTTDDDTEDPHDLTYHHRHIPRASMVDNMVMALDQFSNPTIESRYYGEDEKSCRGRGHTFSSSVSSDSDIRTLQAKPTQAQTQRLARRSSARYARDPNKLPSIFGEDEDIVRVRIYESQRAAPPPKPKKSRTTNDQARESDTASSADLSHLHHLQGRLGPAGNRRSQSFDFGTRRRVEEEVNNHDSAPTPVVYAGPDAREAPVSPSLQPATMGRRNSTKSAKNARGKSSTLGTSAVHGTPAPPLPSSVTPLDKRHPPEQSSSSRPGLFKRFFTSARHTSSPVTASPSVARPSQDLTTISKDHVTTASTSTAKLHRHTHKTSVDISNKENQPPQALQKKPSSFFRRRKKSVSTAIAPPLPLTLSSSITDDAKPGHPSPVSSLKAFMDPYLTEDLSQKRSQTPTSPLHTFYTATQDSAGTGLTRDESPGPVKLAPKQMDRLVIPQKETFLTDSSSAEDVETSQASDVEKSDSADARASRPPIAPRSSSAITHVSTNAMYPTIRPVVEARSSSWHYQGLGVPPRKESLSALDTWRMTSQSSTRMEQRNMSGSDVSEYKSAPSTPAITQNIIDPIVTVSPRFHISHPSISQGTDVGETEKTQKIYDHGEDDVDGRAAAAWLGEVGSDRERIRRAYFELYDFTSHNILTALRNLCSRLVLKAESQLIDRILDAFAKRWCECNPNHGFASADVVHTICYSVLLLNTDLHMADIGSKMTRNQFVKNVMQTVRAVVADMDGLGSPTANQFLTVRSNSAVNMDLERPSVERSIRAASSLGHRPTDRLTRSDSNDADTNASSGPLVDVAFSGSQAGWEIEIEAVLKSFYLSIQKEPLPLFGSENMGRFPPATSNNNLLSLSGLRRTPSVLSKAQSESTRSRHGYGADSRSLGSKWNSSKTRSRPRIGSTPGFGSSRNSLEDQSSAWSPSISSTWSKASLGKTLTSMSVDSFATTAGGINDYQSSIGFANALSQAIIREDQIETQSEDGATSSMKATPLLEDESLELEGAPWAKEGIMKHKCHLDGVDKRSKDRNWNDCFAVIEKGWMRLFSFSMTAKSLRNKARNQKPGGVVGGGNWQDNAEEVWKFMLRHTIASSLPPPGYSKARPHVWALSLPTGAVHLFSVGTPDIVKEFVSTANFWSARLSKEPMIGGVSSMEYGWSDAVINCALIGANGDGPVRPSFTSADVARPSTQMSIRSSLDHSSGSARPKLPGDRIYISEWTPPQQSLLASQLIEVDQLKALQTYVANVEDDLQKHNELRGPMMLAFSSKHPNYSRAMGNWERKSAYLLREIVKFKGYVEALQGAQQNKERICKLRRQEEEQRHGDDDTAALHASMSISSSGL